MTVHPSARRHGIPDPDIRHALDHAIVTADTDEDPDKILYLGPDRAGNILEVITIARRDQSDLVIHAMPMRPTYEPLLREARRLDD